MSHERMLKSERQLEAEMRALLRKAEIIDAQEDGQYGKDKRGDEIPEELKRRSSRLEWIRKAKAELEAEAAAAKAAQRNDEAAGLKLSTVAAAETDPLALPQRMLPTDVAGTPKPQAQRNFTDPDSHILKGSDDWIQGYNAQAAVDGDPQVFVATGVSNQPSDAEHLLPMIERILANTSRLPDALLATPVTAAPPSWKPARRGGWRPTSPPAGSSTVSGPGHHGAEHRVTLMPAAGWIESSDPRPVKRSTAYERQSWSLYSARSREPEAWIASACEGWRR